MKKSAILKFLSILTASVLIAAVISIALLMEPIVKINGFESLTPQKLEKIERSIKVFDSNDQPVSSDLIMDNKIYVPLSQLSQHTIDAFISIEDTRFFEHGGIDFYRIGGSAIRNIKSKSFKEGASTITQQLVKNTHLTNDKNIKRKINEMRIAVDLERKYSKYQILEMYLNVIYFGNNVYGIGAAAKTYFNKPASNLSLNESALLSAIINNPSRYNPVTNPERANARRRLVLSQMKKFNRISKKEYDECVQSDISIDGVFFDQYANFLVNDACEILGISKNEFFSKNLKICTYLDSSLQKKISNLLQNYNFNAKLNAYIQVIVMTSEGDIIANASNTNNDISRVKRQPGSVIKPAIAYAPALEKRLIVPITPILDQPITFNDYTPQNYKDKNLGWISIADALKHSQNIPAVKLLEMSGIEYAKNVATRLGYEFDNNDNHLALALGGMRKGVRLTEIAGSYQAFANGGKFIKSSHINKVLDNEGNLLYKREKEECQAVSKETAYFINEMLSECAKSGTAKRIGAGYAAKTGTVGNENGNTDAFAVAYNKDIIVAVWIGAKSGLLPNTVNGSTHPCIIAKKILELLPQNREFDKPDSIISVDLDKDEYYKNHKLVIASSLSPPKDRISANFIKNNIPLERAADNNFILQMNDMDFENFVIID